ncbi:hypothetical protein EcCFBP13530_04350 [Enterobacter cancerogenus]|uniref:Uncharacterized protein n=1 Tax=Enterobacter cancerogenus TaxID=69218 RepID=A0AB38P992_9ENTR|nr:hypothetical protein [Enterobacter cancerogenus]TKK23396.1 hypothetical protein EcCFBP13530_04350 [Enterobacter cancerogenus]
MSNIDKHGLLGVQKHANQHRLSRLTMEVHTGELRIMASAVESYTDELIAALEAAEKRIAELQELRKADSAYREMLKRLYDECDTGERRGNGSQSGVAMPSWLTVEAARLLLGVK